MMFSMLDVLLLWYICYMFTMLYYLYYVFHICSIYLLVTCLSYVFTSGTSCSNPSNAIPPKGTNGGPKEWGSRVATGLTAFLSRLFACDAQTIMLTDVQTPFLGTPLVPHKLLSLLLLLLLLLLLSLPSLGPFLSSP